MLESWVIRSDGGLAKRWEHDSGVLRKGPFCDGSGGEAIVMPGAWPCGWGRVTETRICLLIAFALAPGTKFPESRPVETARICGKFGFLDRRLRDEVGQNPFFT
jgi:hypothetical protein